ncbi:MAG: hypothetical protein ABGY24_01805 [bacterium]
MRERERGAGGRGAGGERVGAQGMWTAASSRRGPLPVFPGFWVHAATTYGSNVIEGRDARAENARTAVAVFFFLHSSSPTHRVSRPGATRAAGEITGTYVVMIGTRFETGRHEYSFCSSGKASSFKARASSSFKPRAISFDGSGRCDWGIPVQF